MKTPLIAFVAAFSWFVAAIAGMVRFRRLSKPMKLFLLLCFLTCAEISAEYMMTQKKINNAYLMNYSFLMESSIIFTVYFFSIESKRIKQIIATLAFLFLCGWLTDKMYFEAPNHLNDKMAIASRLFIIVISVFMIHSIVRRIDHPLTEEPMFWVANGNLMYSAGVLFVVGLSTELLKMGPSYFITAWYINWSLAIVANVMYAKGFFCTAKSPQQMAQS